MTKVHDMNGVEIKVGDDVRVHYDSGVVNAKIAEIFYENVTQREPGCWLDIDTGDGLTGIMSYIVEVI